jgi:hypothetical protein
VRDQLAIYIRLTSSRSKKIAWSHSRSTIITSQSAAQATPAQLAVPKPRQSVATKPVPSRLQSILAPIITLVSSMLLAIRREETPSTTLYTRVISFTSMLKVHMDGAGRLEESPNRMLNAVLFMITANDMQHIVQTLIRLRTFKLLLRFLFRITTRLEITLTVRVLVYPPRMIDKLTLLTCRGRYSRSKQYRSLICTV